MIIEGKNFPEQEGFVVITKGDERLPIVNMPITQATNTSISAVIPNYEKVALEGEELTLFIVKGNVRSNDLTFQLLHPKNASNKVNIYISSSTWRTNSN
ncbi:hypothetical protein ACOBV8_18045 [Pseudoalteromonas espejiana]